MRQVGRRVYTRSSATYIHSAQTFRARTHTHTFDIIHTVCNSNRNRKNKTVCSHAAYKLGVELQTKKKKRKKHIHASQSSSFSVARCNTKCTDRQARWQWKCAWRKIGPTYLWMFLRFFCFAFRRYSSLLPLIFCRRNITWIRGMFAIGWTHKLSFIMPHQLLFQCKSLVCCRPVQYLQQQQHSTKATTTTNHSFCLRPMSSLFLFSTFCNSFWLKLSWNLYIWIGKQMKWSSIAKNVL